ncbi:glyoxylate reductase [Paenibacillus sophorae]|uniref:D-glycerate dehydrogenase n=1 Tax=Paenibacillus sophorae TaxID=1333845 RepID=A0A1H8IVV4_9BACL|nr:D-glycerate dehydrogenase [Paenibacillus sophorae]QWU16106.1 D-glycerate dehydrogenase [Paenibacillus sophorae]SEN72753.1 glyoxylate reductase [Paenibacillus sophorae]
MAKPVVFIPSKIPEEEKVLRFLEAFAEVDYRDEEEMLDEDVFYDGLSRASGLMIYSRNKIRGHVLDRAPLLKAVSNIAVGYDNLDLNELTRRGILATNTPDVLTETTADLAFSLVLASGRRIAEADAFVKSGGWDGWLPSLMLGKDVHGATLGIIGYGRIGSAIARRARGFNMDILYNNLVREEKDEQELGIRFVPVEELLQNSDYVLVQVPLTPQTEKMISEKQFGLMKKDAYFINASRGGVVDEAALIRALQEKQIAGAGLDVFEHEPIDKTHPFLSMPNVVTLPHIGSATWQTRAKMAMKAAENMAAILQGRRPVNLVNPDVWTVKDGTVQ